MIGTILIALVALVIVVIVMALHPKPKLGLSQIENMVAAAKDNGESPDEIRHGVKWARRTAVAVGANDTANADIASDIAGNQAAAQTAEETAAKTMANAIDKANDLHKKAEYIVDAAESEAEALRVTAKAAYDRATELEQLKDLL